MEGLAVSYFSCWLSAVCGLSVPDGEVEVGFYGCADPFYGDGHLCVDGVDGDIQDLCDLFIFKTVFANKFEDHLAAGWQGFDGFLDLLVYLGCYEYLFRSDSRMVEADMDMVEWLGDALTGFL